MSDAPDPAPSGPRSSGPAATSPAVDLAAAPTTVPPSHSVIGPAVLEKIAAHSAEHVAGVARLQPGVAGMLSKIGRWGRENLTGRPELPAEGVEARVDGDGIHVDLDIVVDASHLAVRVAHRLRHVVARDLAAATGLPVAEVTVTVLDVDVSSGAHPGDAHRTAARAPTGTPARVLPVLPSEGTEHERS